MTRSRLFSAVCACVIASALPSYTFAALLGRLPVIPGGTDYLAYYDDQLDITWAANADINGLGTWDGQNLAASTTTIGGISGWRLPSMDVNGDGSIIDCSISSQAVCTDNEYGHIFYYGAGTTFGDGIKVTSPGPFNNIQDNIYWSSTESTTVSTSAWIFRFLSDFGDQRTFNKSVDIHSAWLVHDGDVATVPLPAALWLFGSGIIVLFRVAGYRKST